MNVASPSARNMEIFSQVTYCQRSWRDVAAEHNISPARVGQIVSHVASWLQENQPSFVTTEDRQKQLMLTYHTHQARLEHWIGVNVRRASELLSPEECVTATAQHSGMQVRTTSGLHLEATKLFATAQRLSREQMNASVALCKVEFVKPEEAAAVVITPPSGGLALATELPVDETIEEAECVAATAEIAVVCDEEPGERVELDEQLVQHSDSWRAGSVGCVKHTNDTPEVNAELVCFAHPTQEKRRSRKERKLAARARRKELAGKRTSAG